MPPEGDHRYFTSTAVFLNEVIKLAISTTLAMYETSKTLAPSTPATVLFEQIYNGVFSSDGWMLTVPAALYTLQNLLQYVAVGNLDPVHFQVLYQVKVGVPVHGCACLRLFADSFARYSRQPSLVSFCFSANSDSKAGYPYSSSHWASASSLCHSRKRPTRSSSMAFPITSFRDRNTNLARRLPERMFLRQRCTSASDPPRTKELRTTCSHPNPS